MPKADETWFNVKFQCRKSKVGDLLAVLPKAGLRDLDIQKASTPLKNGAAGGLALRVFAAGGGKAKAADVVAAFRAAGASASMAYYTLKSLAKGRRIKKSGGAWQICNKGGAR